MGTPRRHLARSQPPHLAPLQRAQSNPRALPHAQNQSPAKPPTAPIHSTQKPASLLLEVVIALAIMVSAMGLMGAQLTRGLELTRFTEQQLRDTQMMERVLGLIEFDAETQSLLMAEDDREYDFDDDAIEAYWGLRTRYPQYMWRLRTERVNPDSDELWLITVMLYRQDDPELWGSYADSKLVRRLAMLRAQPPQIDLTELQTGADALQDLGIGLDQELIDQLPDLLASFGGFESGSASLKQLIQLVDRDTLQMVMPVLRQYLQGNQGSLGELGQQLGGQGLFQGGGGGRGGRGGGDGSDPFAILENMGDMPPEAAAALQQLLQMAQQNQGGGGGGRQRGGQTGGFDMRDLMRQREEYQRKEEN